MTMDLHVAGWFETFSSQFVQDITLTSSLKYMAVVVILYFIVKYLVLPLDWTKEMDHSGYRYLQGSGFRRLNRVNAIRRNRRIGDIPPVFPNGWFMIAESHEIKKNEPLHVSALGENFVLFRGLEGQCHVLDAYCPHLGANMGIGGRVVGDSIECPFHKWQFNGHDGKCLKVPYSDKVPKSAQVKRYKSLEVNDMIFIWYHSDGEEPTWVPEEISEITTRKYYYRGRNEFQINAHIQEIPENGSDLWHFNALHSTSVVFGNDFSDQSWIRKNFKHVWSSTWEPSSDPATKHLGISKLLHHVNIFGMKIGVMDIDIRQMGPGYVEMKFTCPIGNMVITQSVTPVEPLIQKVVHRVYTPLSLALYGTFMVLGETIMVERDVLIWNNKKYLDKPLLVKEDKALAKYRRWFAQFYSENSPTYAQAKRSLEW